MAQAQIEQMKKREQEASLAFQMNNLLQGLNQFVNQEQDQNFCFGNNVDQQQLQQQLLLFQQHQQ